MSEWSNEHDWKSCDVNSIHGFKSHSLRQNKHKFEQLVFFVGEIVGCVI